MEMEWYDYIMIPLVSTVIGWFTNYIAVYMLFKPEKPVSVLGLFNIQGIFPKRQAELANKIGKMVSAELFAFDDIKHKLANKENIDVISTHINKKLDTFFEKLLTDYPFITFVLSYKRKGRIKEYISKEVEESIPKLIEDYANKLEEQINIEEIVADKVRKLSSGELSKLLNGVLKKEFKFIEILGAVLGFVIGVLQVLFIQFF